MENLVKQENGQVVTTSLLVAEKFGKQHRSVLQSIRNLTAENCAVKNLFIESEYINERNQVQPMFVMNRDGFTFLVMGFTGKKAIDFKLDYINAFNTMEKKLKEGFTPLSLTEILVKSTQVLDQHEKQIKTLSERVDILEKKDLTQKLQENPKPKRTRRKRFKVENPNAKGSTRDPFKINGKLWYSVSIIRAMHHLTSKKINISKENRHELRLDGKSIGIVNSEGLKEIARQA